MTITFLPSNITFQARGGESLYDCALRADVAFSAVCRGRGVCGKCKVKIISGDVSSMDVTERRMLSDAEVADGVRLACLTFVRGCCVVSLPDMPEVSTETKSLIELPEGFMPQGDTPERLGLMAHEAALGIAFDIGTTTVVGSLWNLRNGAPLGISARQNPQAVHGTDVISRIQYCNCSENVAIMKTLIHHCLNDIIDELTGNMGASLYGITIVCNTTMSHLFMGVDPTSLSHAPFTPMFLGPVQWDAHTFSLHAAPQAECFLLPNIAGHLGSDIVGVMLATGIQRLKGVHIAIDVGTNGEIVVAKDGALYACSTAAGPAFEGASIHMGMRAAVGAIDGVKIVGGHVSVSVIGDVKPVGICGSGLVDAVAMLLNHGLLDAKGKLLSKEQASEAGVPLGLRVRLRRGGLGNEFVLARVEDGDDIVITQKDIREIQLAKGAILTGVTVLMDKLALSVPDIDGVFIAGAFGSALTMKNVLTIGLLPPIALEKLTSVGNAAGVGAAMALLSCEERERAYEYAKTVTHIALAEDVGFQDRFMKSLYFPDFSGHVD